MYPSPLPEGLADVDTHLLAHLLHQVGLSELVQRAQGDWTLSQDWQGARHAMCHSSTQDAATFAAAVAQSSKLDAVVSHLGCTLVAVALLIVAFSEHVTCVEVWIQGC